MKTLLLVIVLAIAVAAQKTPVWPLRFQQDFVESWSTTTYHAVGKLWYDAERNMSRLDRSNGKFDSFCNSVTNSTTSCHHLVRDNKRYLVFPLLRVCCFCCDSAHGCGILKRDWLSGAKYVGKEDLSGQTFDRWTDTADETDYWATTDAKQVPRKLVEGNQIFKDFIMNTFSEEYIPDATFALPSYCSGTCPGDRCAKFRN